MRIFSRLITRILGVPTGTIVGRVSSGSGEAEALTPEQVLTLIGAAPDGSDPAAHAASHAAAGDDPVSLSASQISGLATVATSGAYSDLSGNPSLGTAAALDVASSGNASSGQVVKGDDTRLSDDRTPTAHTHDIADVVSLADSLADKADLVGGVVPTSQIPSIAITEYLGTAANQTAMLLLSGQQGDWCHRTDLGTAWVITGDDPTTLGDWVELQYPAAPVSSVNGLTGSVVLAAADVGAAATSHAHGNITSAGAIGSTATLPLITGASGVITVGAFGSTAGTFCQGNDSRLSDARTPTTHSSTHQSGGADAIKLDDLATPDDTTDLDSSTSRHGLLRKLSNVASQCLTGIGSWVTFLTGSTGATDRAILVANGTGGVTVQASTATVDSNGFVNTGRLVTRAGTSQTMCLNATAAGVTRFAYVASDTETGSGNAGYNTTLFSYNDAGSSIAQVYKITRASGLMNVTTLQAASFAVGSGTPVVRQAAITAPTGGATVDTECRAAVASLITLLGSGKFNMHAG